jgi:hypothetical protein
MTTPKEAHGRLRERLRAMTTAALRADPSGIEAVLGAAPQQTRRDVTDFLWQARSMVLAASVALEAVLETHQRIPSPYGGDMCRVCATQDTCRTVRRIADTLAAYLTGPVPVGRAEAWRRADEVLNGLGRSRLIGVEELPDAYVTWALEYGYPARDRPTVEDPPVLLMDKRTGGLTRWPPLPLAVLTEEYRRYVNGGRSLG